MSSFGCSLLFALHLPPQSSRTGPRRTAFARVTFLLSKRLSAFPIMHKSSNVLRSQSTCTVLHGGRGGRLFGRSNSCQFAVRLCLLSLVIALCGCQSSPRLGPVEQVGTSTPVSLGPGDVVRISFTTAPELNQAQKIRADGKISLPQVGEVKAAGKTLGQFQSELMAIYRPQLTNTDVLVTLDSGATEVYMSGSVRSPGKLVFDRPTTVLQAIMQAGGPNQFGNLGKVRLIRIANGIQRTQMLDLRPTLAGETTRAYYVKNGDIISVPQSAF